jgi:hypothetical protein
MASVRLDGGGGEHLEIDVRDRQFPNLDDWADGNWLNVTVRVRTGVFGGSFEATFRAEELAAFRDQLSALERTLAGEAVFETMEEQLRVRIAPADSLGHFAATIEAVDEPGTGNRLRGTIGLDPAALTAAGRDLVDVCDQFPVRGSPRTA